jgi:predicted nucleotidyltransferase
MSIATSAIDGRSLEPPFPSGLGDALFTTTQQRVLGLLFGHTERSYYLSEIIEFARVGSSSVQRELQRLLASGLVSRTAVGNQKHYRANPQCPIFRELRGIIRKTVGLVEPLREALSAVAGRVKLAIIYGSISRGTDRASSDVDLLVVSDEISLEALYATLLPAETKIGRRVSPTLYSSTEFLHRRGKNSPFLQKVIRGEHVTLIGEVDGVTESR